MSVYTLFLATAAAPALLLAIVVSMYADNLILLLDAQKRIHVTRFDPLIDCAMPKSTAM